VCQSLRVHEVSNVRLSHMYIGTVSQSLKVHEVSNVGLSHMYAAETSVPSSICSDVQNFVESSAELNKSSCQDITLSVSQMY
jgi:D-aminopeptidase